MKKSQIIIVDLGSQYTQLIARVLLGCGVTNIIVKPKDIREYLRGKKPKGIILSGGNASVYDKEPPVIPDQIFEIKCPILGICYGMQYMVFHKDSNLVSGVSKSNKEYGPIEIKLKRSKLFSCLPSQLNVWASHGDAVLDVPKGFSVIASSSNAIQAIENPKWGLYGVQFHPEVFETKDDDKILHNFVYKICHCQKDWRPQDVAGKIRIETKITVGNGRAAIGVSGGVDSTTLAALLSPELDDKLYPFFIDTGALRHKEVEEVKNTCKKLGIDLTVINASRYFFDALASTVDAEEKRELFKQVYRKTISDFIKSNHITHIIQGTLATDLIESGAAGQAAVIKTHHNVGNDFGVVEIMPFGNLFKHEVRVLARSIGLPESISERKPFPGPGLFIRVIGTPITRELVEQTRKADHIVTQILEKDANYKNMSQVVVDLIGVKTVGVQGDSRSYKHPIVVRVVSSTDFMTAEGMELSSSLRKKIISEVTKHGFNRVWFDETPKPPATTELE